MQITILTLFPEMFQGPFDHSIIKRAKEKGLMDIEFVNIRDFGEGAHKIVDDTPYGGGIGMVMRVDIVHKAIEHVKTSIETTNRKIVLMSASGKQFKQQIAKGYSKLDHLILICGHYEGIDDRINQFIDEEVSIGDYVLTGGELPAMLVTDAVTRLIDGVITKGATDDESYAHEEDGTQLLEYPHFTRPQTYNDQTVPEVLLSGDHKKIAAWRKEKAQEKTRKVRPDLLK